MRILVVSGFLGSGKTTLIRKLTQRLGSRSYAILNGSSALDGEGGGENKNVRVLETTGGCACCPSADDLLRSVFVLRATIAPELLIVEMSGLSPLSPVIRQLRSVEHSQITVLDPVVVLDPRTLLNARVGAAIIDDQILTARSVYFSRTEKRTEADVQAARRLLHKRVPDAEIFDQSTLDRAFTQWLTPNGGGQVIPFLSNNVCQSEPDADQWEQLVVTRCSLNSISQLIGFAQQAIAGGLGEILRVKAALPCAEGWVEMEIVGDEYIVSGCSERNAGTAVITGRKLSHETITALLHGDRG